MSLTINADLHAKARECGLNESRIAEQAIAAALEEHWRERLRKGLAQELGRYETFTEQEGKFSEKLQEHDGAI